MLVVIIYEGRASCVCWIGVCGLFGVQLCYVEPCEGLFCASRCMWRVGVATCQSHGLSQVCNWGWDVLVA